MKTFLSNVAVLLSVIALGGTGLVLNQMFQLQQSVRELNASVQNPPVASEPPQSPQTPDSSTVPMTESSQQANTEIQPGQFVQYAFKNRAQVELLSVRRIQNPDNGQRNVVNVQMRVRNLGGGNGTIVPNQTIARNPETSERYESYDRVTDKAAREQARRDGTEIDRSDRIDRATTYISMGLLKEGSSADGYVWLLIPEEVQTIDLIIPETAIFPTVPISD
jgi:cytoskeletal protein RodZ